MKTRVVVPTECALGEGPTYQRSTGRMVWLDIESQVLHSLDQQGTHSAHGLARRVTCVVARAGGGLVGAAGEWVVAMDDDGRVLEELARVPDGAELGTNDGRCDPHGTLWVGTVDRSGAGRGVLHRVDPSGTVTPMRDGIGLSNGIDWSPDGTRAYYVDSFTRRIDVLELAVDGSVAGVAPFVGVDAIPDGLTVDAEGGVWLALWDGGAVHRYRPDGSMDQVIEVPGGYVTSCAFGEGAWATTLFITTARDDLQPGSPRAEGAGAFYAVDVGVRGRGYTQFGG